MSFTIVQQGTASYSEPSSSVHPTVTSYTFPSPNTAGNMLLVVAGVTAGVIQSNIGISDSRNTWTTVQGGTANSQRIWLSAYIVPSCLAGSNTVQFHWDWLGLGGFYGANETTIEVYEIAFSGSVSLGDKTFITNAARTNPQFASITTTTHGTITATVNSSNGAIDYAFILFNIISGGADWIFCASNNPHGVTLSIGATIGTETDLGTVGNVDDGTNVVRTGFFTELTPQIMQFLLP